MRAHLGDLGDATILPVSFGSAAEVAAHQAYFAWPFDFACDPERGLYRAFGLGRAAAWRLYGPRTVLHDLWLRLRGAAMGPTRQRDVAQLGGDFVLDAGGAVRWSHPGRTPDDRPTLRAVIAAVRSARG